jgi:hypothetical protein
VGERRDGTQENTRESVNNKRKVTVTPSANNKGEVTPSANQKKSDCDAISEQQSNCE